MTQQAWSPRTRKAFRTFALAVANNGKSEGDVVAAKGQAYALNDPGLRAAVEILHDLANQGWDICVNAGGVVAVAAPVAKIDPAEEKARVRKQELLKRDEQLSAPSVRQFIEDMEKPREHEGSFVSIFSLMRDGADLAERLNEVAGRRGAGSEITPAVIDPYVQVVGHEEHCAHTGLRLIDIWRYFRHTWTNQYKSTPGRTMLVLVRDRAANYNPIIGIAALGSPIMQIRERDEWIGWQAEGFLAELAAKPTLAMARWVIERLDRGVSELHLDDLIADGLYWPSLWRAPERDAIARLLEEAGIRRRDHHRFVRPSDFKTVVVADGWRVRAESDLFRSKRCSALADLLATRMDLEPLLSKPTVAGLRECLNTPRGHRAVARVLRRAKAEAVGTEIADLTVCGAIPPYNSILGGKLVSMLAVSPTMVREYHKRYGGYSSEIASSLAGRPINRKSHLVFVGTTSLYGSGSSQYNRVRIPGSVLDGREEIAFRELGRSRSYGTSHLSNNTVRAIVQLSEQSRTGVRVNSIFGEGVNPKLRKVRDGLDQLGWPSDELMQHRRPRIVYGVSLVDNLLPYLLGLDKRPRYLFRSTIRDDIERISAWWSDRWVANRIRSTDVLASVGAHSVNRPVRHGARVMLPSLGDELEVG